MVKSKISPDPPPKNLRESKRTHKPKLIYDPSDSGEQHAASKPKASETDHDVSITEEKPVSRGIKKTIVKATKV